MVHSIRMIDGRKQVYIMRIRSFVIDYEPKTGKAAQLIEGGGNETEGRGYECVTSPMVGTTKALPVFRRNTREACASSEDA